MGFRVTFHLSSHSCPWRASAWLSRRARQTPAPSSLGSPPSSALPTFRAVPSPTAHWSQSTCAAAAQIGVNVTVVTVLIAPKFWFSEIRRDSLEDSSESPQRSRGTRSGMTSTISVLFGSELKAIKCLPSFSSRCRTLAMKMFAEKVRWLCL